MLERIPILIATVALVQVDGLARLEGVLCRAQDFFDLAELSLNLFLPVACYECFVLLRLLLS